MGVHRLGRRLAAVSALGLVVSGIAFTGQAAAAPITSCTAGPFTITSPGTYTLTADLTCPGDGIVVRADNVVVDLNGFRLFGSGDSFVTPKEFAGVRLDRVRNATVTSTRRGGTIANFNAGVAIEQGSGNTVTNLSLLDNAGALSELKFHTAFGDGVTIRSSSRNNVRNNTVVGNGPFSGISVVVVTDDVGKAIGPTAVGNNISGNVVIENDLPRLACLPGPMFEPVPPPCPPGSSLQPFFQEDIGIRLEGPGAQNTTVSQNTVLRNGADGVLVSFTDNTDFGSVPRFVPLNPENFGNVIIGNTIRDNGFGPPPFTFAPVPVGSGILLLSIPPFLAAPPDIVPPHHNVVADNVVTGNRANGISVQIQAHSNVIRRNTSTGNGPPPAPFPFFDLFDGNQPGTPPTMTPCNGNLWQANTFGTRNWTLTPTCIS